MLYTIQYKEAGQIKRDQIEAESYSHAEAIAHILYKEQFVEVTSSEYTVNVGNVGNISCDSLSEARDTFDHYVRESESGFGRAGSEPVFLLEDGEAIDEHFPEN